MRFRDQTRVMEHAQTCLSTWPPEYLFIYYWQSQPRHKAVTTSVRGPCRCFTVPREPGKLRGWVLVVAATWRRALPMAKIGRKLACRFGAGHEARNQNCTCEIGQHGSPCEYVFTNTSSYLYSAEFLHYFHFKSLTNCNIWNEVFMKNLRYFLKCSCR